MNYSLNSLGKFDTNGLLNIYKTIRNHKDVNPPNKSEPLEIVRFKVAVLLNKYNKLDQKGKSMISDYAFSMYYSRSYKYLLEKITYYKSQGLFVKKCKKGRRWTHLTMTKICVCCYFQIQYNVIKNELNDDVEYAIDKIANLCKKGCLRISYYLVLCKNVNLDKCSSESLKYIVDYCLESPDIFLVAQIINLISNTSHEWMIKSEKTSNHFSKYLVQDVCGYK